MKLQPPPPLLFFSQRTVPGFAISKFTAPSFHGYPRTAPGNSPLKSALSGHFLSYLTKLLYQKVSRTHLNVYYCYMMENIECKDSDSSLILQHTWRTAPLFLAISPFDSHRSAVVGPQLVPFSRPTIPIPGHVAYQSAPPPPPPPHTHTISGFQSCGSNEGVQSGMSFKLRSLTPPLFGLCVLLINYPFQIP